MSDLNKCGGCNFVSWSNWFQSYVCALKEYEEVGHLDKCPKDTVEEALLIIANFLGIDINTERETEE